MQLRYLSSVHTTDKGFGDSADLHFSNTHSYENSHILLTNPGGQSTHTGALRGSKMSKLMGIITRKLRCKILDLNSVVYK